ncbi:hypothetical protein MUK42_35369 [Musa troglodytarum]|uniref:Uncharacterized protein n=1 Tax=Musa troglodytarum TaxID=320322 RepID=A0A9E7GJN9_9LILI|nr:hypothetical protein MUK42_35369 [Musa troglodytarum]
MGWDPLRVCFLFPNHEAGSCGSSDKRGFDRWELWRREDEDRLHIGPVPEGGEDLETLDDLRTSMENAGILFAVMLDNKVSPFSVFILLLLLLFPLWRRCRFSFSLLLEFCFLDRAVDSTGCSWRSEKIQGAVFFSLGGADAERVWFKVHCKM